MPRLYSARSAPEQFPTSPNGSASGGTRRGLVAPSSRRPGTRSSARLARAIAPSPRLVDVGHDPTAVAHQKPPCLDAAQVREAAGNDTQAQRWRTGQLDVREANGPLGQGEAVTQRGRHLRGGRLVVEHRGYNATADDIGFRGRCGVATTR